MGVPESTPNTPTLVMVNVPPTRSDGGVLPDRAVSVRPSNAPASSRSESVSASRIFGTISPRGVAAAIPSCTRS
jgi:hypothetical protein